jgi:hypothetical protein
MTKRRPQSIPLLPDLPSVEYRVAQSTEIWARDLRALFEHAKDRFGDVTWESEGDGRIWGHKGALRQRVVLTTAVIYARAPSGYYAEPSDSVETFKDRYFPTAYARSPSLSPMLHPGEHVTARKSPQTRVGSSLSVQTMDSDATARGDGILRLTHGDTPELFRGQLE